MMALVDRTVTDSMKNEDHMMDIVRSSLKSLNFLGHFWSKYIRGGWEWY